MGTTFPSPAALITPLVGTASIAVAAQNLTRLGLYVFNPSATITLWVAPAGKVAAVNGSGSIAVQPLQGIMLGPPTMPGWNNGLNAIASSGAGNAITLLEYYP
jgi:hypothetical protein